MKRLVLSGAVTLIITSFFTLGSCNTPRKTTTTTTADNTTRTELPVALPIPNLKPRGSDPDWGRSIDNNMLVVIEKMESYHTPPLHTLTPQDARQQPGPANAAKDVIMENKVPMAPVMVDTMGRQIPVEGGQIHARIYKPKGATGMLPVIVYYHGGGWVIADINSYDASARGLAEKTNAILVSVHYRQAPEYKFPTAHNDAFAAYEWVLANAGSFGGDANKVALAGESAGGNLACNVSIMARDRGIKMPLHQLLVYPIADDNMNNQSYQKYANAKPLNKPLMEWFAMHYLNNMAEGSDPRISLVDANLRGLPPTTLISAQIDPLHDEGRILASRLRAAGVDVRTENYEGVTHEFFGMDALLDEARKAQLIAAYQFRKSFGTR